MSEPARTVFATLLASHRQRLDLTQAALAARTADLRDAGVISRTVTERTIAALERLSPDQPRVPHQSTVRALAVALGLAPGTPGSDAFIAAAHAPTITTRTVPVEPDAAFIAAGRHSQLTRLAAMVDLAVFGMPAVGVVTGPAGSGKSRLLEEACRAALERHPDAVVLWTACPRGGGAMAAHEPCRSIVDQVMREPAAGGAGNLPVDNERRLDARLADAAPALVGPATALAGTLLQTATLTSPRFLDALGPQLRQRVADLAPVTDGRMAAPEAVDGALVDLLKAYAAFGPLVLVIEDMHWADAVSIGTIRHLVDALAVSRVPLALLVSRRTGEGTGHSPDMAAGLQGQILTRFPNALVDLDPAIGGEAGRAFVDAAVARLHLEPLAQRLFERTSGMPLFVMSFLRLHAMDHRAITGNDIPEELDAVFGRQLARLDDRARALLAAASVQGDEFLAEPALAVAGFPPEEGTRRFDEALAGQVRPLGAQPVAPGTTMHRYRFAHAVLRDHVVGTLSRLEQSHLHLATADALTRALGSRGHGAIELIATHLERGGDLPGAAAAWIDAGDRAMLRSDHLHALGIYRHARELGVEAVAPEAHVQALVGIGNSQRALGRPDAARHELQRARREASRRHLHTIDANALMSLGVLDVDAGRMVAGAARFGDAVDAYTRAGNVVEAARATANLSIALHAMGRYDDARLRAERALDLAREADDAAARASAELALSNCWLDLGYYELAIARYEAELARTEANGLSQFSTICLLNMSLCEIELGRWHAAESALARLDAPERRVVDRLRSVIAFNSALLAEARGDLAAARRGYDASRNTRMRLGQEPLLIDSLAGLLRVAAATGDTVASDRLRADIASRIAARGIVGVEHLGRLYLALVESSRRAGDEEGAGRWLSEATAVLAERADQLAEPDHRASYLTRPTAHRRLLDLARTAGMLVPAPSR